jgi:pyrroline-5-carboxylate reductase
MSGERKIAVIGAGNIGGALVEGILREHVARPECVRATVGQAGHATAKCAQWGIQVTAGNNLEVAEWADVVILAVKPGMMAHVLGEIRWGLREGRILISLAAAFPLSLIEKAVSRKLALFRAMPNIPVTVGEGATAIACNSHVRPDQLALVESIFRAVGAVCLVPEDHMHAVTALSGSGPAYIYMVIEAMVAGGLKMGLSHDHATRLAEQTVLGAAKLVRESGVHPAILRDHVITPGGVTISAVHELERHGLRSMLISAIETATRHSRRLTTKLAADFALGNP